MADSLFKIELIAVVLWTISKYCLISKIYIIVFIYLKFPENIPCLASNRKVRRTRRELVKCTVVNIFIFKIYNYYSLVYYIVP